MTHIVAENIDELTHRPLVTSYVEIYIGQQWLR